MKRKVSLYSIMNMISILIYLVSIVLLILFWDYIPDTIPTHYNAIGAADHYGDKSSVILIVFLELIVIGGMFFAGYIVKLNGKSTNATPAELDHLKTVYPMLAVLNVVIVVMFSYILYCSATARNLGAYFMWIFIVGVVAPIAWYLWKYAKNHKKNVGNDVKWLKQQETTQGEVYRSKIDWWLAAILIVATIAPLYFMIQEWIEEKQWDILEVLWIMVLEIFLFSLFTIHYVLYENHLAVKWGMLTVQRIPYDSITSVKPTCNPLSSMAMSLKRIQIDYGSSGSHNMILISPIRREEFIQKVERKRNKL